MSRLTAAKRGAKVTSRTPPSTKSRARLSTNSTAESGGRWISTEKWEPNRPNGRDGSGFISCQELDIVPTLNATHDNTAWINLQAACQCQNDALINDFGSKVGALCFSGVKSLDSHL